MSVYGATYKLTWEELENLAHIASEKAIAKYSKIIEREKKSRTNENVRITKKKLQAYRRTKTTLSEEIEFTEDEKVELRWKFVQDLMGVGLDGILDAENTIKKMEQKRRKDSFEVQAIEKALEYYEKEAEKSTNEEFKRRYSILKMMYFEPEEKTVAEIAEERNLSEKTVYRDLGIACEIMSVYLLGM